jgi:methionine-gamma-lyase
MSKKTSFETKMIHGESNSLAWDFSKSLIPPVSASTTFRLGSVERGAEGFSNFGSEQFNIEPIWIYDRLDEPNTLMLEKQLSLAEGTETAVTFSTGMGAIASTLFAIAKSGDDILTHQTIYGCSFSFIKNWLPKFNVSGRFEDLTLFTKDMIKPNTRVIYFETVSNPTLEVIDLPKIKIIVDEINKTRSEDKKILIIVDNTFATPCGCLPAKLGADFVIQSLTKNISGFGTEMGGAVMTSKVYESLLKLARKDFGAVLHPHAAWDINVHGLPTLLLRYQKQQSTAIELANYLSQKSNIEFVSYPGLDSFKYFSVAQRVLKDANDEFSPGYMIAFQLKNPEKDTIDFVNYLAKHSYCITLAVSLGLTKTLIELPNFMTHSGLDQSSKTASGISPYLIRMSIGLENVADLKNDIDTAMNSLK